MSEVRRAVLLSTAERYVSLTINFVALAAVSRILTPSEVGFSVVGMAIVSMAITVREFASSGYIIQHPELKPADVRGAFTVMLGFTLLISTFLAAGAPMLAARYGAPQLTDYFWLICVSLLVELVSTQVATLLRRDLAFGKVAAINLAATFSCAVATVGLALAGFSYMSFAWGWFAAALAGSTVAFILRPATCSFVPSLHNWRDMLAFGGYNGGNVLVYRLFEQAPYLALGGAVSAGAAAIFSRSLIICQLPDKLAIGGSASVILPAFAAAARQGGPLLPPYLKGIAWATGLLWPAHLTLAVLAHPVVDLLLGSQWGAAAPLVQIVAIASLFAFSFEFNYPVLVAVGAIRDTFLRSLIVFPAAVLMIYGAAYFGGLYATAWSLMVIVPFHAYIALHFVRRRLGLRWADLWAAVRPSAIVGLMTGIGPLALVIAHGEFDVGLALGAAGAALAGTGWILGLWLTRHPLAEELPRLAAIVVGALRAQRLSTEGGR